MVCFLLLLSCTAFVTILKLRKPLIPRNNAYASRSSRMFRILEGACKLVVLSLGDEKTLLSISNCIQYPLIGSFKTCLYNYLPCLWVQHSSVPKKPIPSPGWKIYYYWSAPCSKQLLLKCIPLRHRGLVATYPHGMEKLFHLNILLVYFR